jgi:hypothetical protein
LGERYNGICSLTDFYVYVNKCQQAFWRHCRGSNWRSNGYDAVTSKPEAARASMPHGDTEMQDRGRETAPSGAGHSEPVLGGGDALSRLTRARMAVLVGRACRERRGRAVGEVDWVVARRWRPCGVSEVWRQWRSPQWEQEREKSESESGRMRAAAAARGQKKDPSACASGSIARAWQPHGVRRLRPIGHGQNFENGRAASI